MRACQRLATGDVSRQIRNALDSRPIEAAEQREELFIHSFEAVALD
jgi:hypothetical protein